MNQDAPLDDQIVALVSRGKKTRAALRRWGRRNGHLVSTVDNAVTRLLWAGRLKGDGQSGLQVLL